MHRGTATVLGVVVQAVFLLQAVLAEEQLRHDANLTFPTGFLLGVSTAAYQIEGAWNESGKGENIWDRIIHTNPDFIASRENADVACDSYHKFQEDVQLVKEMGLDVYRFSLSWSRLFPFGGLESPNPDGLRYYNAVIDECLKNGIRPMVTLYHKDLPQTLQDIGGWPNEHLVEFFEDYAKYAFKHFGDRVKMWVTFNEPLTICTAGYGKGFLAPAVKSDGRGDYMCGHTILKAHARAYRLYQDKFKASQGGVVGISLNTNFMQPTDANNPADVEAAETLLQFMLGWFAHPIFSTKGDYPPLMKQKVQTVSEAEGLRRSRLPRFTNREIRQIQGSADFFGLNSFTTQLASPIAEPNGESRSRDHLVATSSHSSWERTGLAGLSVVPWGMRKLLVWVRRQYGNPPVYVTETGYCDSGELHDVKRVNFHQGYLSEVLRAIHEDQCDVRGYVVWTLLDNFEWTLGYASKFGLVHVDFNDTQRRRTPKLSAKYWKMVTGGASPRRLPTQEEIARLQQHGA